MNYRDIEITEETPPGGKKDWYVHLPDVKKLIPCASLDVAKQFVDDLVDNPQTPFEFFADMLNGNDEKLNEVKEQIEINEGGIETIEAKLDCLIEALGVGDEVERLMTIRERVEKSDTS